MTPTNPPQSPAVALTDELIHDLASYWVYIRPGNESQQYDELRDFARAVELACHGNADEALEIDTSDCDDCCGKGWNWEEQQVAERATDTQTFKIECQTCCGRGYVGPDADRRAALASRTAQRAEAERIHVEGPVNPGEEHPRYRLRKPGETLEHYRIAMGWDKQP